MDKTIDKQAFEYGNIKISEEALCAIGLIKTLSIKGVVGMSSNLVDGFNNLLGRKALNQGIRLNKKSEKQIELNIYVIVQYGFRIPEIALHIQESVKSAVEELTDFTVIEVNVFVQGIMFEDKIIERE